MLKLNLCRIRFSISDLITNLLFIKINHMAYLIIRMECVFELQKKLMLVWKLLLQNNSSIVFLLLHLPALVKFNNAKKIQKTNNILGTLVEDSKIEWFKLCNRLLELHFEFELRLCDVLGPPESTTGPNILKG